MSFLKPSYIHKTSFGKIDRTNYGVPVSEGGFSSKGYAQYGSTTRSSSTATNDNEELDYTNDTIISLNDGLRSKSEFGSFYNKQFCYNGSSASPENDRYDNVALSWLSVGNDYQSEEGHGTSSVTNAHRAGGRDTNTSYDFNLGTEVMSSSVTLNAPTNRYDWHTDGTDGLCFNEQQSNITSSKVNLSSKVIVTMNVPAQSRLSCRLHGDNERCVIWGGNSNAKEEFTYSTGLWSTQATTGNSYRSSFNLQSIADIYSCGGENGSSVYATCEKSTLDSLTSSSFNNMPTTKTFGGSHAGVGYPL